jgi:hypothetical protein
MQWMRKEKANEKIIIFFCIEKLNFNN